MSGRVVLVTGTDTGVGKTWVACGLARALRAAGARIAVRKPVETGCAPCASRHEDGAAGAPAEASAAATPRPGAGAHLHPADGAALRDAAGGDEPLAIVCPLRFAAPLAPAFAAAAEGAEIDVGAIAAEARRRAAAVDVLLVEGAGGLLVPLAARTTFADLALALEARILVVVGARLGAINHALLTVEAARSRGLDVAGLVVNHFAATRDAATESLVPSLRAATDAPVLARIGYGEDPAPALAAAAAALRAGR